MRLAFYTYSYIDRLGMEPEPVLEQVAAAGYDGIDLSATWRDDDDPALFPAERRREIRAAAERLGLKIEALVTHLPMVNSVWEGRPINLPGAVDLAVELGSPIVTVHGGDPEAAGRSREEGWQTAIDYLRSSGDYSAERGVAIAVDAIWPQYLTRTPDEVTKLIGEVDHPAIGHNFDPCYTALCGFDPAAAARQLASVSVHVHVKDHVGDSWRDFEHRIPGLGRMDHAAWISALREAGYQGAIANECFVNMPLTEAITHGHAALREALSAGQ